MVHLLRKIRVILIVSAFFINIEAYLIEPKEWEDVEFRSIVIKEGDALEMVCHGNTFMNFYYPGMDYIHYRKHEKSSQTSDFTISRHKNGTGSITNIFRRPRAVHGDTGFYGCIEINNNTHTDLDPEFNLFNKTIFYVTSSKSLFGQKLGHRVYIMGKHFEATFGCDRASREIKMELERHYRRNVTVLTNDKRFNYHPSFGFRVINFAPEDNGLFVCKARSPDGRYEERLIPTIFFKHRLINEPNIKSIDRCDLIGGTLEVECHAPITNLTNYILDWELPMNTSLLNSTKKYTFEPYYPLEYNLNVTYVKNILKIFNTTKEDEGVYKCVLTNTATMERKISETYIQIYDPTIKYLNLTTEEKVKIFIREPRLLLALVVDIDAYPKNFTIRWLNPQKKEIYANEKFEIDIWPYSSHTSHNLYINKIDFGDAGIYTVEVTHATGTKTMQFELIVQNPKNNQYLA
ncbi:uncharacterized protein LOC117174376 [Belonocnema kinseyi]|uniref:uncharacterized protein LOC117174376 n=1 Tax=Belonocnema kinseyi TaxID=2817044 RepID=UPI00143D1D32|nr:uncharacterized protein LOC117174376 [Belonocnema kinseyi]